MVSTIDCRVADLRVARAFCFRMLTMPRSVRHFKCHHGMAACVGRCPHLTCTSGTCPHVDTCAVCAGALPCARAEADGRRGRLDAEAAHQTVIVALKQLRHMPDSPRGRQRSHHMVACKSCALCTRILHLVVLQRTLCAGACHAAALATVVPGYCLPCSLELQHIARVDIFRCRAHHDLT